MSSSLCLIYALLLSYASAQTVSQLYQTQTGDGTWYTPSLTAYGNKGSCTLAFPYWPSFYNPSTMFIVAMNKPSYNGGLACGLCVQGAGTGAGAGNNRIASFFGLVGDLCPECQSGALDFNQPSQLDGRWTIQWSVVDCPVSGGLQYVFQGSHQWYWKVQVRNQRVGIQSVSFTVGGSSYAASLSEDNFWLVERPNAQAFPVNIAITSVFGETLTDTIPYLKNDEVISGNGVQFSVHNPASDNPSTPPSSPPPSDPPPAPVNPPPGSCVKTWEQCGGRNWNGGTTCCGAVCTFGNEWYYQCIPIASTVDQSYNDRIVNSSKSDPSAARFKLEFKLLAEDFSIRAANLGICSLVGAYGSNCSDSDFLNVKVSGNVTYEFSFGGKLASKDQEFNTILSNRSVLVTKETGYLLLSSEYIKAPPATTNTTTNATVTSTSGAPVSATTTNESNAVSEKGKSNTTVIAVAVVVVVAAVAVAVVVVIILVIRRRRINSDNSAANVELRSK